MVVTVTQPIREEEVWVSFIGPLLGKYARVPYAENNMEARWIMNNSKLKSVWCATYSEEQVEHMIRKYGGEKITLYGEGMGVDLYDLRLFREKLRGQTEMSFVL